jgi:hypothetical protein
MIPELAGQTNYQENMGKSEVSLSLEIIIT